MLLTLVIMSIGVAVMFRGVAVIGWLTRIVVRGLVVFAILGAVYVVASQMLDELWRGRRVTPVMIESQTEKNIHEHQH